MRHTAQVRILSAVALFAVYPAAPASATRTAVDGGSILTLGGYCSPNAVLTADCDPRSLPGSIVIGGTTYSSFWVNSNGTVTFDSIAPHLATQDTIPTGEPPYSSLAEFGSTPVFSPNFSDGPGFQDFSNGDQYDGSFVADTTLTATGFTVNWYTCGSPLFCGPHTAALLNGATFNQDDYDNSVGLSFAVALLGTGATGQEQFDSGLAALLSHPPEIYTMTLTELAGGGFQVDYLYNQSATGQTHPFGFSFPGTLVEDTAPLTNRTYVFNALGQLVEGVPEPSTWMTMLLGFGLAGAVLRRQRRWLRLPA